MSLDVAIETSLSGFAHDAVHALLQYDPLHDVSDEAIPDAIHVVNRHLASNDDWLADRQLVADLAMRVARNTRCLVHGARGAGKSTGLLLLARRYKVTSEEYFFHIDVTPLLAETMRRRDKKLDKAVLAYVLRELSLTSQDREVIADEDLLHGLLIVKAKHLDEFRRSARAVFQKSPDEITRSEWAAKLDDPAFADACRRALANYRLMRRPAKQDEDAVKALLTIRTCVIAIDNVDELGPAGRSAVARATNAVASLGTGTRVVLTCRTEHVKQLMPLIADVTAASIPVVPYPEDSHWDLWNIIHKRLRVLFKGLPGGASIAAGPRPAAQLAVDTRSVLLSTLAEGLNHDEREVFHKELVRHASRVLDAVSNLWNIREPNPRTRRPLGAVIVQWNNGNIRQTMPHITELSDELPSRSRSKELWFERRVQSFVYRSILLDRAKRVAGTVQLSPSLQLFQAKEAGRDPSQRPFYFLPFRIVRLLSLAGADGSSIDELHKLLEPFGVEISTIRSCLASLCQRENQESGLVRLELENGINTLDLPAGTPANYRDCRASVTDAGSLAVTSLVVLSEFLFWSAANTPSCHATFREFTGQDPGDFTNALPSQAQVASGAALYLENYLMEKFKDEHDPYIDPLLKNIDREHHARLNLFKRFGFEEDAWLIQLQARGLRNYMDKTQVYSELYVERIVDHVLDCGQKLDRVIRLK